MSEKELLEDNITDIGLKIKGLREDKGLTVEAVSKLLNYSAQAYSHWENGRRSFSIEILKELSNILDFTAIINNGKLFINAKSSSETNKTKKEDEKIMRVIFRKSINGLLEEMTIKGDLFKEVKEKISAYSIEMIRIREDIAVLIDEEAGLKSEPKTNFWYDAWYLKDGTEYKVYPQWILGDVVFVGIDKDGEFNSLTDEQCEFVHKYLYN